MFAPSIKILFLVNVHVCPFIALSMCMSAPLIFCQCKCLPLKVFVNVNVCPFDVAFFVNVNVCPFDLDFGFCQCEYLPLYVLVNYKCLPLCNVKFIMLTGRGGCMTKLTLNLSC